MKNNNIRINTLVVSTFVTMLILCVALLASIFFVDSEHNKMSDSVTNYSGINRTSLSIKNVISKNMEYTLDYAQTGSEKFKKLYDSEETIVKTRALFEKIKEFEVSEEKTKNLADNIDELCRLNDKIFACDGDVSKATEIIYSEEYLAAKNDVILEVEELMTNSLEDAKKDLNSRNNKLGKLIFVQKVIITLLILSVVISFMLFRKNLVNVIKSCIERIAYNEPMDEDGIYELKYLAASYNKMIETKQQREKSLRMRAEKDPLTGLDNRGAFEIEVYSRIDTAEHLNSAFMLIDVDEFKLVNDNYGHDMGDKVLQRVAALLKESFNDEDEIGRIGGDEFAAWIQNITPEDAKRLTDKIDTINHLLKNPDDGIPQTSLSIGIVFYKENQTFEEVFKEADNVLYTVKSNGRCGCAISQI